MFEIGVLIVTFAGGFVTCFYVMRNNRKYFQIDDIIKGKKDEFLDDIIDKAHKRLDDLRG